MYRWVLAWFWDNWPEDLAWPADVPRPDVDYRFRGNDERGGNDGRGDNYKRVGNGARNEDDGGSV